MKVTKFGKSSGFEHGRGNVFADCDCFEEGEGGPVSVDTAIFHRPRCVLGERAFDVVLRSALGRAGHDRVADIGAEVEERGERYLC